MYCKRFIQATLAAVSVAAMTTTSVLAADLSGTPRYGSIKDEPTYARAFSWTGVYVGGHVGGAWLDVDQTRNSLVSHYYNDNQVYGLSPSGLLGGGHIGANYQTDSFVFGVELSYSGGEVDDAIRAAGPFALNNYNTELNDLFTATGRLGFAADRWLVYVKGGYATAEIATESNESPAFAHFGSSSKRHDTMGGSRASEPNMR
ncbi:MAG: outer membrane beta-barrel protein [Alphaproteobacteria bacterium]|nr:outer membrane beta-barrel protein [Alphaproteobacteria bacterium]